jgi:transcription initiation factor IIF auxiliary subunit
MADELAIRQSEKYEGDDWWKWAVWLEGPDEALNSIEFVEWILHPTFRDPVRRNADRAHKFRLETGGWGAFRIIARVQTRDGKQTKLHHHLKLHYPDGTETTA